MPNATFRLFSSPFIFIASSFFFRILNKFSSISPLLGGGGTQYCPRLPLLDVEMNRLWPISRVSASLSPCEACVCFFLIVTRSTITPATNPKAPVSTTQNHHGLVLMSLSSSPSLLVSAILESIVDPATSVPWSSISELLAKPTSLPELRFPSPCSEPLKSYMSPVAFP